MTKKDLVLNHLKTYGSITSLEAISLYNATRLSGIIFNLKKCGHEFSTESILMIDRYGNKGCYAKYNYLGQKRVG